MTAQPRIVNKSRFEQGDSPQGSDYEDLIDSFLSLADTTAQSIASSITVPSLTVGGEILANTVSASDRISANALSAATAVSAGQVHADALVLSPAAATVLTTAQTSALLMAGGQGVHKIFGLIRVTISGTTVAMLYTNPGTFLA